MSSHLVPMNPDIFDRWVRDASAANRVVRIRAGSPWQGLVPDLDPNQSSPSGMSVDSFGLIARPGPDGAGEILMPDAGFTTINAANLPIITTTGTNTNVTMLAQFDRTKNDGSRTGEWDLTILAFVGGDNTAGTAELWRLKPSDDTWQKVTWETVGTTATHNPGAGREFLSDWAVFPAGAPDRSAYTGAIAEPVFVWCNLQDRVMVYPNANEESGSFEPLTDRFTATFKARTVESFGGRLYFGNTIENTTQYRQRIRRTALFTADPLETAVGAGAFDIRDFSGELLRLEKMGDLMVAYFEDGVAFVRQSGLASAPDRVQLLREKRGLIGTHAVTSVGNQEHFGIFDDGWYFLDPSGRWTEVGMLNIDGKQVPMWKDTFYNDLDDNYWHRTVVAYDGRYIRIAFTKRAPTDPDNQEVWVFDPRGNRVFRDIYPVTCWGLGNIQVQSATAWDAASISTKTWSSIVGSWSSFAAKFGVKALMHGTTDGYILRHNYDLITKYNTANGQDENPTFKFSGKLISGGDPTTLKRAMKLWVEHIHSNAGLITLRVEGDPTEGSEDGQVNFSLTGSPGDIQTAFRTFNFTAANLRFSISGTAPIQIRSILADIELEPTEERNG